MLMTAAIRSAPLKPDVPKLLSRARAIAEIVHARVQETEANRRIADDVIAQMREAGLFRVLQPQAYGGFEYGFDVFAELVATIGRGCGSSAWVYGLGAAHQWFVACFPKEAQEEFWGRSRRHCSGVLCAGRQDAGSRRRLSDLWSVELR